MASSSACRSSSASRAQRALLRFPLLLPLLVSLVAAAATPVLPGQDAPTRQAKQQASRPKDAAALFTMFGKLRGMSASYTEKKHLSLLAVPLTSSGKLHFLAEGKAKKGHLVRSVEKPEKSKLTITEAELRMADANGTEVIDLRQSDRVRLFVTSLMRIFQGDRAALQKHYQVRYVLDAKHATRWQLELTPKKEPLDKILKRLALFGDGQAVTRIELVEPNGDRTVTTIDKVDPKRTFTASEKLSIFGIKPQPKESAGK